MSILNRPCIQIYAGWHLALMHLFFKLIWRKGMDRRMQQWDASFCSGVSSRTRRWYDLLNCLK
jgi:hypothetical protein